VAQRTGTTIADTGVAGYRFETITLNPAANGRGYRLRVASPDRPAPPGGHPVVWLLDGNAALMDIGEETLARLARRTPAPVIVFVAHDNDLRIDGDARAYDYTPRRPGGEEAQGDPLGGRRNGGADAFLDLLAGQARSAVAARVKVDPARQALWGHSYGGIFVLHALFTRPQAFSAYGAVDPSLWWGDGHILREEADAAAGPGQTPRLWLWLGEGDAAGPRPSAPPGPPASAAREAMLQARRSVPPDAAARMAERLRARGMAVELGRLPGVSHGQTLGASLPLFLDALFPDVR
jgi:predicted alpha/beta superfamily hydrolase